MDKEVNKDLLEELYLLLLARGPGYLNSSNIEFWDPTCDAVIIFEELTNFSQNKHIL